MLEQCHATDDGVRVVLNGHGSAFFTRRRIFCKKSFDGGQRGDALRFSALTYVIVRGHDLGEIRP